MNALLPLMQREWLQHRRAWLLLSGIPLGLGLLALMVSGIDLGPQVEGRNPPELALLMALATVAVTAGSLFTLITLVSVLMAITTPRRDHGDRSVEFWLSLPTGHAQSLGTPLLVHLLLVPAAALVVGTLGGWLLSAVLVGRSVGFGEWLALPWTTVLPAVAALVLRVAAGLPLALLWLAPLVALALLANAFFRRWGLPVLGVSLVLASQLAERIFGQPLLTEALGGLLQGAAHSLLHAKDTGRLSIGGDESGLQALVQLPGWALRDFGHAVQALASPLLLGGLVLAAALFWVLMQWRARGAGASGD